MASVKNLKKEINYVLGDLVNIVYIWEMTNGGTPSESSDVLVEEIYENYDNFVSKIRDRKVENKKAHYKQIRAEYETVANQIVAKINELK